MSHGAVVCPARPGWVESEGELVFSARLQGGVLAKVAWSDFLRARNVAICWECPCCGDETHEWLIAGMPYRQIRDPLELGEIVRVRGFDCRLRDPRRGYPVLVSAGEDLECCPAGVVWSADLAGPVRPPVSVLELQQGNLWPLESAPVGGFQGDACRLGPGGELRLVSLA
jgi:hypothetical protein